MTTLRRSNPRGTLGGRLQIADLGPEPLRRLTTLLVTSRQQIQKTSRRFTAPASLALVIGIASFVRLETIVRRPIWYDEIYTHEFALNAENLGGAWRSGTLDGYEHPPLHYVISYWMMCLDDSLFMLRLPSALAGVISVFCIAQLGSVLFSRRDGILAGALAALSVYHVNYSMDGRPYMMALMLVTAQYLAFFSVLKRPRSLLLIAFVVLGTAGMYTSHVVVPIQAILLAVALGVLIAALQRRRSGAPESSTPLEGSVLLLTAFPVMAVLYMPQLVNSIAFLRSGPFGEQHSLIPSARFFYDLFSRWGGGPGMAAYLYLVLFGLGLVEISRRRNRTAALLLWFATPLALFTWIPFSKFFDIRFVIASLPPFFLVVAVGSSQLAKLARRAGSLALEEESARRFGTTAAWAVALLLVCFSAQAYATFRVTEARCSNFFWRQELLVDHNGFCRKHILLNTLIEEDGYLLLRSR